jgi:long-chain acyl-CoA synthetase
MKLAAELKVAPADISIEGEESIEHDRIYQHLMNEVKGLISREQGFKPFEFISRILPVRNDFSIGKELTQTLKVKRQYVIDKYHGLVKKLMSDSKKK